MFWMKTNFINFEDIEEPIGSSSIIADRISLGNNSGYTKRLKYKRNQFFRDDELFNPYSDFVM